MRVLSIPEFFGFSRIFYDYQSADGTSRGGFYGSWNILPLKTDEAFLLHLNETLLILVGRYIPYHEQVNLLTERRQELHDIRSFTSRLHYLHPFV